MTPYEVKDVNAGSRPKKNLERDKNVKMKRRRFGSQNSDQGKFIEKESDYDVVRSPTGPSSSPLGMSLVRGP